MATVNDAGRKGGLRRTAAKAAASRNNAAKARELKLLYRLNPSLKKGK